MDVPKTVKSWAAVSWALVWAPWCMGRSAGPAVQTYAAGLSAQQRSMCWWCHLSFLSKAAVIVHFLGQNWIEMSSSTTSEGLTCPPVRRMLQAANSGISVQLPKLWAPLCALCFGSGHAFLEVQRCYVQRCYPYFCGCSPKCGLGVGFVSLFVFSLQSFLRMNGYLQWTHRERDPDFMEEAQVDRAMCFGSRTGIWGLSSWLSAWTRLKNPLKLQGDQGWDSAWDHIHA